MHTKHQKVFFVKNKYKQKSTHEIQNGHLQREMNGSVL